MEASPNEIRSLCNDTEQDLEGITRRLDNVWRESPYVTINMVRTSDIDDKEITAKCSKTLLEFNKSPPGKIIELMGRSSVEWMGRGVE